MPAARKRPHRTIGSQAEAEVLPASHATPTSVKEPKAAIPANFQRVWKLIEAMRQATPAPVDTMGCERLADEAGDDATRRYQHLISLMLSSQTKDEMTAAV
eukprot:EG_transcript_45498